MPVKYILICGSALPNADYMWKSQIENYVHVYQVNMTNSLTTTKIHSVKNSFSITYKEVNFLPNYFHI